MPPTHPPQSGTSRPGRPPGPRPRNPIQLPNGEELVVREVLANDLGVSTDTIKRMKLPVTYIGGLAHHPRKECLDIIASRIRRPATRRRGAQ